jgi:cytosine/adenosine deaminase-related metal-dependent hydrolase
MLAFRARYVFPVVSPPIRDGIVAIDHDRIVAVGEFSSPALRELLPAARDLGDVAILPGLINSHTHLEFSNLRQPLGKVGMAFADWIRLVVNSRQARLAGSDGDPIAFGVSESVECGVTALGEIASSPWQRELSLPLEVTEFCEVICFRRDRDHQRYRTAVKAVTCASDETAPSVHWTDTLRPGISPHTPYTVRPELIQQCVKYSAERSIPLAIHLAETREELQLLKHSTGPMVDLMQEFDQWDPDEIPRNTRPLNYLKTLAQAHRALVIHGNYLDDDEIDFLAAHVDRMSAIYCPRTHAFFHHEPYPLTKMLAAGVNVALGTDSRASNPDLSILSEMRFAAAQHLAVPPTTLLRMITVYGARALGRDSETGTLTPGKLADLAIVALPSHSGADPYEQLLDSGCHVLATIFRGRAVYGQKLLMQS